MKTFDAAVIGGGIIGATAAAYLAEAGRSVVLLERAEIAAGASGRNSGAVQHPFDPVFATLHRRSLELYHDPRLAEAGFALSERPDGLMLISFDEDAVSLAAASLESQWPELSLEVLPPGAASRVEPALAAGVAACRIETAYAVAPGVATQAFAERARKAGADVRTGADARVTIHGNEATGVTLTTGETLPAGAVLVAAGPWTPALIPGWAENPPITSIWGVVVSTTLEQPPVAVLEEIGVDRVGVLRDRLFSMVTADGRTSVGSTFLTAQQDAAQLAPEIMDRGVPFVPALRHAAKEGVRACARPQSIDGLPLIGAVAGIARLFVCAGHGPWGISTGPASAELVARQMVGEEPEESALTPSRYTPPVRTIR